MNTDQNGKTMAESYSEVLEMLRDLPPRHFEQFIADVWQERQNWNTKVMDKGKDRGIDIVGEPPSGGKKTAVQCKRYQEGNKVTSKKIQQYSAIRQQREDIDGVTVVTTSSFTRDALNLAENLNVRCIDGNDIAKIVDRYNATDILEWYDAGKPEDW